MLKFKYFLDPMEQEVWINEVQAEGYKLESIFMDFMFKFEETNEDYVTRIDYQGHMSKEDYDEYTSIFEDFGWEKIRGGRFSTTTQVFRKVRDGNDDIFSDKHSIVDMYKRYITLVSIAPILVLVYIIFLNPEFMNSIEFLTPGLWEMEGLEFWRAFLFELPFVALRFGFYLIIIVSAIIALMMWYKMDKVKKKLEEE